MGDGDAQNLAWGAAGGEGAGRRLGAEMRPLAAELQVLVAHERAGEQPGFAEDLEAVAASDHRLAVGGVALQRAHDGGEAGDGAGAQVVAVGEAAGGHHAVVGREVGVLMPHALDLMAEHRAEGVLEVAVAPGAGKDDDAESHGFADIVTRTRLERGVLT